MYLVHIIKYIYNIFNESKETTFIYIHETRSIVYINVHHGRHAQYPMMFGLEMIQIKGKGIMMLQHEAMIQYPTN
jgi:hypothetical protein